MNSNKILFYTVIIGQYDQLIDIPRDFQRSDIDFICVTDDKDLRSNSYQMHVVDKTNDATLQSRRYKILAHRLFPQYDLNIYIDGKISVLGNLNRLLDSLNGYDLMAYEHYKRQCLYQEAATLLHPYKLQAALDTVVPLISKIKHTGFPKMFGLADNSILIRKNTKEMRQTMDLWFEFVSNYSSRDQLSMMYCVWQSGQSIKLLPHHEKARYFKKSDHRVPYSRKNKPWLESSNPWLECFDPFENRPYFFNYTNRLCKWELDDSYSEEHYRFLQQGIAARD
jgi:hypothetical protein